MLLRDIKISNTDAKMIALHTFHLTAQFVELAKRTLCTVFFAAVLLGHSSGAHSTDNKHYFLKVEYKNFYTHLRKLDPQHLPHLHFAFGFILPKSKSTCAIDDVLIHTPKKDIPIAISSANRFSLPRERALKLADAEVHIQFQSQFFDDYGVTAEACDLSVRLEANLRQQATLSAKELQALNADFKSFFENMGIGLFSFMMPEPQGIKIHLQGHYVNDRSHGLFHGMAISNGTVLLADNWISRNQQKLDLSRVSHITAWVNKQ